MYCSRDTNKLRGQLLKSLLFGGSNRFSGAFWVFHPPGAGSNTQVGLGEIPTGAMPRVRLTILLDCRRFLPIYE